MKRTNISILLSTMFISACNLFPVEDNRYLPLHQDAALLRNYSYITNTASAVVYEVQVSALTSYDNETDLDFFLAEEFILDGDGTFQIIDFSTESVDLTGNSSTILLIDQSGSYLEIDPHNNRSKAINKFLEDFDTPSEFMVGGFSDGGALTTEPVEYASQIFSPLWQDQPFLFGLTSRTGGNSVLYDAIDDALDKLISSANTKKNLIVLQHASDAMSMVAVPSLIAKANANNITINMLLVGTAAEPEKVWELMDQTGGIMASCPGDADLTTIFTHLHRLLERESIVYNVQIQFTPTGGNILSGNEYENVLHITDMYSGFEFNPVYVKIKIP